MRCPNDSDYVDNNGSSDVGEGYVRSTYESSNMSNVSDRGKYLYNIFTNEYGLSEKQALGVLSAMYQESREWKTDSVNKTTLATGIGQWLLNRSTGKGRKKKLVEHINSKFNKSYTVENIKDSTFVEQVSFLKEELSGTFSHVISEIKKSQSSDESARIFGATYEQSTFKTLNGFKQWKGNGYESTIKPYTKHIETVKNIIK